MAHNYTPSAEYLAERHANTSRLMAGVYHGLAAIRGPRLCPTWWLEGANRVVHLCSVDAGHAGPHVDLVTGAVRLGHEPYVWHTDPVDAILHLERMIRIDATGVDTYTHVHPHRVAMDWWQTASESHDHRTCGHCPAGVWEGP